MKVLLTHNYYRLRGGEDAVFQNERILLESKGVEVILFERSNDDVDVSTWFMQVGVSLETAWSNRTYQQISQVIQKTRPDVAHFHNTFPLISPSAYKACQDNNVPVVQTLHNYRLICPGGMLHRDGRPCEDCVGTNLLPALRHRCYRGSFTATGAVVWMLGSNRWRGSYRNLVNRYIALTEFAGGRLVKGGIPKERITVKPNFLNDPPPPGEGGGGYAVYVGRLSPEKGVHTLLEAWKHIKGLPLKILGDGPSRVELEVQARQQGLAVEFLGFRPREEILKMIGKAEFQVIPSEWYEGFPMVVLEAYACGTPVVSSRIGSLDEVIIEGETGTKFEAGNSRDMAEKINAICADRAALAKMRRKGRAVFDEKYTSEKNYVMLSAIYNSVIDDYKKSRKGG